MAPHSLSHQNNISMPLKDGRHDHYLSQSTLTAGSHKRLKRSHSVEHDDCIRNWLEDTLSRKRKSIDNRTVEPRASKRSRIGACSSTVLQVQRGHAEVTTQKPKRKLDQEINREYRSPVKRGRLTRGNIQAYCQQLQRGTVFMGKSRRKLPSQTGTASSQNDSQSFTTSSNSFGEQLLVNGIIHTRSDVRKPKDADDIKFYLQQSRRSQSPEEEDWKEYLKILEAGSNERTLQHNAWSELHKPQRGGAYRADYDLSWTEVEDSSITLYLKPAKPDMTESLRWREYPQQVIDEVGPALRPTSHKAAMPIFAVEAKSLEKGIAAAEVQCAYDGALMVNAAKTVHKYLGKSLNTFYEETRALSIAYNGDDLTILAHHAILKQSDDASPATEYHSYPLFCGKPRSSVEQYKAAHRETRNAQQWCRERSIATLHELQTFTRQQQVGRRDQTMGAALASPPQSTSSVPGFENGGGWIWSEIEHDHYRLTNEGAYEWRSLVESRERGTGKVRRVADSEASI